MATAIQRRRGNTAQHASFTGLAGEITIDTDKNTVVVHDGSTAGGFPLATQAEVNALGGADITAVVAGDGLTGGATSGSATINVVGGAGITVSADNVAVNATYVKNLFSATDSGGDGSFSYSDGVFTYTGPSATEVRAHLTGGAGLTFSGGAFAVGAGTGITVNADDVAVNAAYVKGLFSATDAGGDGSFSYSDGVFTYTGPSQAEANVRIDARLSGTAGITYSSGAISVNQSYFDKSAGGTGLAANFEPAANNTYSLGSLNNVWKDVYVGPGSLYVNGQKVLADNSGTITVSSDAGQNLALVTSAGGDIELSAGATGDIQLKSNVILSAGKTITASGGLKLSSNLDVNSQYINNLTNPVQAQDAATKQYVDLAGYLTAGDGLSKSTGTFSVDSTVVRTSGSQTIAGTKVFSNDVTVSGNLTVSGTTITVNSETISLADNIIDLNSNFTTGSPTENAGIRIKRGDSADVQLRWNEADDKWQFTNDGSTYADILTAAQVKALFSATDSGGDGSFSYSDGVFTYTGPSATEVRAHLTGGAGLTFTTGTFAVGAGTGITVNADDVAVNATYIKSLFSATDAGGDGSFSYSDGVFTYTGPSQSEANARIDAYLVGGNGLTYSSGNISVGGGYGITVNANGLEVSNAEIRGLISGSSGVSYNSTTGAITLDSATGGSGLTYTSGVLAVGAGAGITVNADNVALSTSGVTAGTYGSASAVGQVVVDTYGRVTSASNTTISITASQVSNFSSAANSAMDAYLSGGAGLTYTSGVLGVGAGAGITVNADNVALSTSGVTSGVYGGGVHQSVQLTVDAYGRVTSIANVTNAGDITEVVAGNGLTGGGTANVVTVNVVGGYGITVNADNIELSNANVRALFSGSSGVDYNSTTGAITLASGTGGAGLTYTSGVLAVGAGNYITVAADSVAVDATTTATASKVAARDASGDLYANIFQGTASSARYADLAERYEADAILEPGTVVCFGGTKEITACDHENDHAVAGVVSTDPAYMMNSAAGNNDTHPYIALTGRVPVKVVGPVAKGDLLVASGVKGHAMANNNAKAGTIIGKAIGSSDSGEGVVEALINLM